MADNTENFVIKLTDKGFSSGMDRADDKTNNVTRSVKNLIATGLIFKGIGDSIEAFDQQEQAIAQVKQGIQSTGGVAGKTFEELASFASKLQTQTLFGDEEILQGATAQLLTFTNIAGEQFDRTTMAALDLSARLGTDLKGSAIQLGKALNDPVANLSALSRSGIQFTKDQKSVIKGLVESNRLADAQTIILDELEKQYGGSASAAAKAGKGGFTQLGNAIGDIKEEIGGLIIEGLNPFLPTIFKVVGKLQQMAVFFRENADIVTAVVVVVGTAIGTFSAVSTAIRIWTAAQWLLNVAMTSNPIGLVITAIAALTAGVLVAWNRSEKFRGTVLGVWAALKVVGNIIYDFVEPAINGIGVAFDYVSKVAKNNFGKIKTFVIDTFKQIWKFVSPILKVLAAPITIAGKAIGGSGAFQKITEAFSNAFSEEVNKEEEDQEESLFSKRKASGALSGSGIAGAKKDSKKGLGSGISEIKASAPKNFNINIASLVKELNINTTNLREGSAKIKEEVTKALLLAVNDLQVISE